MIAKHFLRRGYPEDLVVDAMIEVRRMDRPSLLAPKDTNLENQKRSNTTSMVTSFNPAMQAHKSIIMHNWPYLGAAQSPRETFTERPNFGHRRALNVNIKVPEIEEIEPSDQERPKMQNKKLQTMSCARHLQRCN